MTSCIERPDLAEQNFRTRVTLEKLALACRLFIARFVEKFNLQFRIVKKLNQEDKESWPLRYVKTCHRVPQNIEAQGLVKRFLEQCYRLSIGL